MQTSEIVDLDLDRLSISWEWIVKTICISLEHISDIFYEQDNFFIQKIFKSTSYLKIICYYTTESRGMRTERSNLATERIQNSD